MLLYGCSLVYGFSGSTSFHGIVATLAADSDSTGILVGAVFIAAGLAFKISAVPFHMWTPDVYEGAPTPVTAFFSAAPKMAAMALLVRVLVDPFAALVDQWQQIIFLLAVGSMALGALGAIGQRNIKRLMAYSFHWTCRFLPWLALPREARQGFTACSSIWPSILSWAWGPGVAFLPCGATAPWLRASMISQGFHAASRPWPWPWPSSCFSMAGIPPLAGFFGKFYVFLAAIDAGLYTLTVIGVLMSVVGAFYYIRIVKLMYFDDPADAFDRPVGRDLVPVIAVTAVVTVGFFLFSDPLLDSAPECRRHPLSPA